MYPLDVNPLEPGLLIGEWRSDDWDWASYSLELSTAEEPRVGEPVLCLSRTFGRGEKARSKSVWFGLEESKALIRGLATGLAHRPAADPIRNLTPVGFVEVPGFGDLFIGWGPWFAGFDSALYIRQHRCEGGTTAVTVWHEYVDEVVPWLMAQIILTQRRMDGFRAGE